MQSKGCYEEISQKSKSLFFKCVLDQHYKVNKNHAFVMRVIILQQSGDMTLEVKWAGQLMWKLLAEFTFMQMRRKVI